MDTEIDCCREQSSDETSQTEKTVKIKAESEPVFDITPSDSVEIKPQISAPSYLNYLRDNDAPPFKRPEHEPMPHILTGTWMNEAEAIAMVAASDADEENGMRNFLGNFLVEKNIIANYSLSEKNFLISLLMEAVDYAAQRDFDELKLSVLITIYIETHLYFKWYYWQSPAAVWGYFKELMIRHSIDDTPYGEMVFSPEDCYDIITHFHTVYLTNLPLIHILIFGTHRIKLLWPFKPSK